MSIKIRLEEGKKVNAHIKGHIIKTDQPERAGGENSAPAPFDLFLASIGTCSGIYVKSFCEQRNIPTDNISIDMELTKNPESRMIDKIEMTVNLPDDFPEKYKKSVIHAANLCAVKKHLHTAPEIEVKTT